MDKASQLMGETAIVGVAIATRGSAAKMMVGGVVGAVASAALAGKQKNVTTPGGRKGNLYVALGPTKLAFFTLKQGLFKNSAKELIAEHPRSDVTEFEIEGGFPPKFSISFADGTQYNLECGNVMLKQVKKIKAELGK